MPDAYNPDVLSCLANLSSDEVFTPPNIVNQMLDLLPAEIWRDPNATFLDPAVKTGVFLREIARRLMAGLEDQIPDRQQRINHIFTKQIFGIAITDLTALLARRSVYCSKKANGKYSVCNAFDTPDGNICFQRMIHVWQGSRCKWCGASLQEYDRDPTLESHAYQFIHTANPEEIFKMNFDVIVGNPPYQLNTGGSGVQAIPVYNKFVLQAKKLNPRFLTMIIPSRWFSGGFGLDSFRDEMLTDDRLRIIHDFPEAIDCFPGVQIKGGVCYFLWDRDDHGNCAVTTHQGENVSETVSRPLLEPGCDFFIRYNEAISILHKVRKVSANSLESMVSSQKPFGLATTFRGSKDKKTESVTLFENGGISYVPKSIIEKNVGLIDEWKVFIPRAGSGSDKFPHPILGRPFVGQPNSACTETYLTIGPFNNERECLNVISYIQTRFFRFMVMLKKPTQDALRGVYSLVPIQDFLELWNDSKLYKKYKLTKAEIKFIESLIRPMGEREGEDE
jgi:site-specific DNA-methyltransferase (adenine-specific)